MEDHIPKGGITEDQRHDDQSEGNLKTDENHPEEDNEHDNAEEFSAHFHSPFFQA